MAGTVAMDKKLKRLQDLIRPFERVIVAFSGGVDSTFLLRVAVDVLGADNVLAVTADSPSVSRLELAEARKLAEQMGARHQVIRTYELDDPRYAENPPERCYFCRLDLNRRLRDMAEEQGYSAVLNGTNADDHGDWRPGMRAADEFGIVSPLADAGITKEDIRRLSREMGLPTHDKPANPCLATRIAYGVQITPEVLAQIERAEEYLRGFGLREFRVRHHGDLARLELPPHRIAEFVEPQRGAEVVARLRELGYTYVTIDLAGFRSGSMNDAIERK